MCCTWHDLESSERSVKFTEDTTGQGSCTLSLICLPSLDLRHGDEHPAYTFLRSTTLFTCYIVEIKISNRSRCGPTVTVIASEVTTRNHNAGYCYKRRGVDCACVFLVWPRL